MNKMDERVYLWYPMEHKRGYYRIDIQKSMYPLDTKGECEFIDWVSREVQCFSDDPISFFNKIKIIMGKI